MASPSPSPSSTIPQEPAESQPIPSQPASDPTPPSDPQLDKEPDPKGEGNGEEEEEGECGFCLFMKGGGCKEEFVNWENCVESAEKNGEDIVNKCFDVTAQLKKCMDAHSEYYEPVLRAEQAMSDSIAEEVESSEEELKSSEEESIGEEPIVEKEKEEEEEEGKE